MVDGSAEITIDTAAAPEPAPDKVPQKVAIVGFSDVTRKLAPYNDPSFEIWGMGSGSAERPRGLPRMDRWFEMHRWEFLEIVHKDELKEFRAFLAALTCPVYLIEKDPEIPTSITFPLDRLSEKYFPASEVDAPFWTNTVAYMMALALDLGAKEIHLFGVDMVAKEEYVEQRPGVTYFIGYARGAGVKCVIPRGGVLMRTPVVYGYEDLSALAAEREVLLARRAEYQAQCDRKEREAHNLYGRVQELDLLIGRLDEQRRGATW